jgi:hypothetical protein
MTTHREPVYSAPVFLGTAFLLFGIAILEKALNLVGWSIPFIGVFPRQVLDWAVALLMFEIALTLRQLVELRRPAARSGEQRLDADRGLN